MTKIFTNVIMLQTEIAKRLNAIIAQILPFLSQEHQQQVASAVERAKQVTMTELNAIIGVRILEIFSTHINTLQLYLIEVHECEQTNTILYT